MIYEKIILTIIAFVEFGLLAWLIYYLEGREEKGVSHLRGGANK
jgi:hypothetical protein